MGLGAFGIHFHGWLWFSVIQNIRPFNVINFAKKNQRTSHYNFCSTLGVILKGWPIEVLWEGSPTTSMIELNLKEWVYLMLCGWYAIDKFPC